MLSAYFREDSNKRNFTIMAKSNYADKPPGGFSPVVHKIFPHDNRAFTPHGGANGEHLHGALAKDSSGDGFWKPRGYRNDTGWIWSPEDMNEQFTDGYIQPPWRTAELEAQMPTFRGVPPSPAEQFRGQVFARA